MAVNLAKGQKVDLTKNHKGLRNIIVGLGWDVNKYDDGDFDLDAAAFLLTGSDKVRSDSDFVFYNNLSGGGGSVKHTGDNRTGEGEGDDEQLTVDLAGVPADVEKVAFTITIADDTGSKTFGQVSNAFVRIVDEATNEELIRYDLGEDYSVETAVVVGELYRHSGEWKFAAVGSGFEGGLAALCGAYGIQV